VRSETIKQLELSYARSSVIAARSRLYAARVQKAGQKAVAELLTAMAAAEEIQARRILMYLRGKLGDATTFLSELAAIQCHVGQSEYPRLSRSLEDEGEKKAAEAIDQFGRVASNHAALISRIEQTSAEKPQKLYVCQVCGFIADGSPPEKCPVCNAIKEKFKVANLSP
jgi:rubrerythrin